MDFPIENGDFPYFFVCLPEGILTGHHGELLDVARIQRIFSSRPPYCFFLTKKGGMALEAPKSPIGKPQMPKSKSDDG